MTPIPRRAALPLLALLLAGPGLPAACAPSGLRAQEPAAASSSDLIVLVRHAERDGPSASDPGLTATGSERALELARLLADAGITRIHSTEARRTRETAQPLARALGIEVELYDGRDLAALASRLRSEPGRHLVVGHSNTTPELAERLGGEPHGEIVEEWEYDRLYLLTPESGGKMRTVLLRFGPGVERELP
jgi:2,3-bisphosphoglycerate-dependent phosphoglycerate mutase